MEENNNIREIEMDELKEKVDGTTSAFMDESLKDMLRFVEHCESKEDYWFVKYYEAACFAIFTMGAFVNLENNRFWINLDKPIDEERKKNVMNLLSTMISKDIWNTFKGREELAFRIFAYGTHYVREDEEKQGKNKGTVRS